jgi:hypothetical protein
MIAALGGVGKQLQEVGGGEDEGGRYLDGEFPSVGLQPFDRQISAPLGEDREQLRVAIEPDNPVPAPGQMEGDPSRPAAELEDRAAAALGQLLPEGQIGPVGTALDVVPDRGHAAHRQNSSARPRSEL